MPGASRDNRKRRRRSTQNLPLSTIKLAPWLLMAAVFLVRSLSVVERVTLADEEQRHEKRMALEPLLHHPRIHQARNLTKSPKRLQVKGSPSSFSMKDLPDWLARYIQFCLRRIVTKHEEQTHQSTTLLPQTPHLVYVDDQGGLGDRIPGVLTVFFMAICTQRVFLIDTYWIGEYLQPNWILWNATYPHQDNAQAIPRLDNQLGQYRDPLTIPRHVEGFRVDTHNRWIKYPHEITESSCLQNLYQQEEQTTKTSRNNNNNPILIDHTELYYQWFWTLFQFTDKVLDRSRFILEKSGMQRTHPSEAMTASSRQSPPVLPYIGVHIRTGDSHFRMPAQRHHSNTTAREFYQCAQRLQVGLQECLSSSSSASSNSSTKMSSSSSSSLSSSNSLPPIYIASDLPTMKEDFARHDPSSIHYWTDMEIFHVDRSLKQHFQNASLAELNVWAELHILMEATCVVYSESGFSKLAVWTGSRPRCAVSFQQCGPSQVQAALANVGCGGG